MNCRAVFYNPSVKARLQAFSGIINTDLMASARNTSPWENGSTVEDMIAYYYGLAFSDFTHAISKTPIIKSQHPDYELYLTGIHAYRGVSCADCHMPYHTEGGMKFTDHHFRSPLLNISNSCAVCHRWSEKDSHESRDDPGEG